MSDQTVPYLAPNRPNCGKAGRPDPLGTAGSSLATSKKAWVARLSARGVPPTYAARSCQSSCVSSWGCACRHMARKCATTQAPGLSTGASLGISEVYNVLCFHGRGVRTGRGPKLAHALRARARTLETRAIRECVRAWKPPIKARISKDKQSSKERRQAGSVRSVSRFSGLRRRAHNSALEQVRSAQHEALEPIRPPIDLHGQSDVNTEDHHRVCIAQNTKSNAWTLTKMRPTGDPCCGEARKARCRRDPRPTWGKCVPRVRWAGRLRLNSNGVPGQQVWAVNQLAHALLFAIIPKHPTRTL